MGGTAREDDLLGRCEPEIAAIVRRCGGTAS